MRARKLWLPALAAALCIGLVAMPATASAAKKKRGTSTAQLKKQLSEARQSLQGVDKGIKALVNANKENREKLASIFNVVVPAATDALTQLRDGSLALKAGLEQAGAGLKALQKALEEQVGPGMKKLEKGLTDLAGAVQGPNVAGQLGAAGTDAPGSSNSATPSTLPTGTVYRQIVLLDHDGNASTASIPIGARTWVKMPDVAALGYANTYACTGGGLTAVAKGLSIPAAAVACP